MRWLALFGLAASIVLFGQAPTQPAANPSPELVRAQEEMARVTSLVEAGAAPEVRLKEAQANLADAQDNELLRSGLAARSTPAEVTEAQAALWVAAAQRRLDRARERAQKAQNLVASGVMSRSSVDILNEEIARRQEVLNLVSSRAQVIAEVAAMARAELAAAAADQKADDLPGGGKVERFSGSGNLSDQQIREVVLAYQKEFGRPLPISAKGETAIHRAMGFDHRGRVDVALLPDAPEGEWLRRYLTGRKIPYIAFRDAVRGSATGAHIHIGPPSLRLSVAD